MVEENIIPRRCQEKDIEETLKLIPEENRKETKNILEFCTKWTRDSEDQPQDMILMMIFFFFVIFDSDPNMIELEKAEGLRMKYLLMLQRYLKNKYGPNSTSYYKKLDDFLQVSTKIQTMPLNLTSFVDKLKHISINCK